MNQSRTKPTILAPWHSSKDSRAENGTTAVLPYLLILALLCAVSVVTALRDPLSFAEIFGGI